MEIDQFKCLLFILGIRDPADADIKAKLLHLLDTKAQEAKIEKFVEECESLRRTKEDTMQQPVTHKI
jgi:hypothetical protein